MSFQGTKDRLISAIGLLSLLVACIVFYEGKPLVLLFLAIALLSFYEIYSLERKFSLIALTLFISVLCFYYPTLIFLCLLFIPYVFFPYTFQSTQRYITSLLLGVQLYILYYQGVMVLDMGPWFYISLQIIASLSDTGGYIFGKAIPSIKLQIPASPHKTLSGYLGALILTPCLYVTLQRFIPILVFDVYQVLLLTLGAIIGDLVYSALKRSYKIKDFSQLIPGHGGVSDRVDSLVGITAVYLMMY